MQLRRVTELLVCPEYQGPEYDESRFNGHAVEAILGEHLKRFGFTEQVEVRFHEVMGHVDFMREADGYIEIIEVKNTASMKYLHILQLASYKSLLYSVYNKPVIGHLMYVKFETVIGEAPVRPQWVPKEWKYVHLDVDSGGHYINWLRVRSTYRSRIAGPYCIMCRTECKLKDVVRNGLPKGQVLNDI